MRWKAVREYLEDLGALALWLLAVIGSVLLFFLTVGVSAAVTYCTFKWVARLLGCL